MLKYDEDNIGSRNGTYERLEFVAKGGEIPATEDPHSNTDTQCASIPAQLVQK